MFSIDLGRIDDVSFSQMPKGLKSFMNGIEGVMTRNQNTGSTVAAAVDLLGNVGSTFVGDLPKEFKVRNSKNKNYFFNLIRLIYPRMNIFQSG